MTAVTSPLEGRTVLITGGTGTFGRKFAEISLREHNPTTIRVFSRDEWKQHQMRLEFGDDPRLRFFIGDVRDLERLRRAMNGVDLVIHAAALKQIPACEYNPFEAIKTNVLGAQNVIEAAIEHDVERVIALSTDKAVNPVNLYGATKLCAEKLFIQGNAYTGGQPLRMSCVRYGNVVASRGSVLEVFAQQAKTGIITITDERMTRFWITKRQAVDFVLSTINAMHGGEVFVPKLPSMRIVDLARVVAPDAEWKIIGIRPGEKLDEVLVTEDEGPHTSEFESHFLIRPEHRFWDVQEPNHAGGRSLPPDFRYSSSTNDWVLTPDALREMLAGADSFV